jgi:hypothetical protein
MGEKLLCPIVKTRKKRNKKDQQPENRRLTLLNLRKRERKRLRRILRRKRF